MKSSASPTISRDAARLPPLVLDPCTLGRPTHLLGGFSAQLKADLVEVFRSDFNRRYRAAFEVGEVLLERHQLAVLPPRWQVYAAPAGRIGFGLDRSLLLCILGYRYGETLAATPDAAAPVRETATEERLAGILAGRFIDLLTSRIDAKRDATVAAPAHDFTPVAEARPGGWTLRVEVTEPDRGVRGSLWFSLDEAWMGRLLRRLAPARDTAKESTTPTEPLVARLQLTLAGRLLQKELPLGDLVRLRIGDVLPISLGATDVLIDDSRLFTAAVVEHKGKLCLTSFEQVE
jgi:flagellar motor switch protein FliM